MVTTVDDMLMVLTVTAKIKQLRSASSLLDNVLQKSFWQNKWFLTGCLGYPVPGPHKSSNKLNLHLVKVQSLLSCAHYFQWFTGYLNNVDLLMSHVHVFKETTPLFNVHLSFLVDFILCPTDKCMFKVNNKKIRLICWMCSKVKINTAWHCSGVFIVDFDHSNIST